MVSAAPQTEAPAPVLAISGLEDISGGRIEIGGRDVTQVPPRDRDIAMVFQSYALYPTMSVAENIGFGMKIRKVERGEWVPLAIDTTWLCYFDPETTTRIA